MTLDLFTQEPYAGHAPYVRSRGSINGARAANVSKREVVLDYIRSRPDGATREEIHIGTGLPINVVCGRVGELLHSDPPLVVERGERESSCGVRVGVLRGAG